MARLEFADLNHAYLLDGVRVPSVTQILQATGAMIDFSKIPQPILLAARDRGSAVHRAAHYWLEGDLDVVDFFATFPEYGGYLQSLMALFATGRLTTVACERRVASPLYGFAGTFDWVGLFDGKAALLDWATGAPSDVAKDLQTSAYEVAAREWASLGEDPLLADFLSKHARLQRIAVRLDKTGALPKLETYTDPNHFREFRVLLEAQQIIARRKGSWITVAA
jgi:hypothetical protein